MEIIKVDLKSLFQKTADAAHPRAGRREILDVFRTVWSTVSGRPWFSKVFHTVMLVSYVISGWIYLRYWGEQCPPLIFLLGAPALDIWCLATRGMDEDHPDSGSHNISRIVYLAVGMGVSGSMALRSDLWQDIVHYNEEQLATLPIITILGQIMVITMIVRTLIIFRSFEGSHD